MIQSIGKVLNIRSNEWSRVLLLYSTLFLFVVGWTWGASIIEADFLQQLGVEALPWFFIIKGVVSIPLVALYAGFADRIAKDTLTIAILAVGGISTIVGLLLLGFHIVIAAFPLLYLTILVVDEMYATHWYTYANDFFDTRSAKRVIPVLGTAVITASIVGGLSLPLITKIFTPTEIILLWFLALLMTMLIVRYSQHLLNKSNKKTRRKLPSPSHSHASKTPTKTQQGIKPTLQEYMNDLREGYQYIVQSSLLRWMAVSSLCIMMLMTFLEYQTSTILLQKLSSTEKIANFIGIVVGVSNVLMLPFQLFLLNRIINRIGVGNANIIFPVANLGISGSLIVAPGLPTAALSYFNRDRLFPSLGYITDSLIYNAVPVRMKGRARGFIGGLVFPLGSFFGGILLLVIPLVPGTWFVPTLIAIFAIAYFVGTLVIRRQYTTSLIAMLEEDDYSFLLAQETDKLPVSDPATIAWLKKKLGESTNEKMTIFIAKLISMTGGDDAIPILGEIANQSDNPVVRSSILDILNASDARGDMICKLYTRFLEDEDASVRQSALAGLEDIFEVNDLHYLNLAKGMLDDSSIDVRTQATIPLLRSQNTSYNTIGEHALQDMLRSKDPNLRVRGIQVIERVGNNHSIPLLLELLCDKSDEVRLEATLTFERFQKLPDHPEITSQVMEQMKILFQDPVERIRMASLVVLGHTGNEDVCDVFIQALMDHSLRIRTMAVDILVDIGKKWQNKQGLTNKKVDHNAFLGHAILEKLQQLLDSEQPHMQRMAAVVLCRINQEQFGHTILTLVQHALQTIYHNRGRIEALNPYITYPSVKIIHSALKEYNQQLIDDIFYLLSSIHNSNSIRVVTDALQSEDSYVRANATEALETLTTPQIAQLIEPLFDPDVKPTTLFELSNDVWGITQLDTREAIEQLAGSPYSHWLRTMMIFALGEIGADLAKSTKTEVQNNGVNRRHRGALGKLNSLFDDEPTEQKPVAEPKEIVTDKRVVSVSDTDTPFLTCNQIETMIELALKDADKNVQLAAIAAKRKMAGVSITDIIQEKEEEDVLSTIERIIFLKGVPFFQGMTVDQLKVLATVCEEQFFPVDTRIFSPGDAGGTLYMIISGRVAIEQEKRTGSFARLSTVESHSYFGEESLFDNNERTTAANAIQDTLTLRLQREPLIALARQHPDLSLELISVLSERLREANKRIAELTRTRPRELHKLFDQFD